MLAGLEGIGSPNTGTSLLSSLQAAVESLAESIDDGVCVFLSFFHLSLAVFVRGKVRARGRGRGRGGGRGGGGGGGSLKRGKTP